MTPIPLASTRGDIDIDLELYLKPLVDLSILADVVIANGGVGLTLGVDVPKLGAHIQQVHSVTSDCKPANATTPSDQIYTNLTQVTPELGVSFFEVLHENFSAIGIPISGEAISFEQTAYNKTLDSSCYHFNSAKKSLVASPPAQTAKAQAQKGSTSEATLVHHGLSLGVVCAAILTGLLIIL